MTHTKEEKIRKSPVTYYGLFPILATDPITILRRNKSESTLKVIPYLKLIDGDMPHRFYVIPPNEDVKPSSS